jgi:hypothetical protein
MIKDARRQAITEEGEHARQDDGSVSLRLERLQPIGQSLPFDCSTKGFRTEWWCDGPALNGREHFSVLRGTTELARAVVDPNSTDVGAHSGLTLPAVVVKIEFFEVRKKYRCRNIGRDAVAATIGRYEGAWLTVVSTDSGGFWQSIGWSEARNQDRPDVPSFRYLWEPRTNAAS